ncbi:MAG: chorismate synthase [Nitrospiraceae bacterium]|nr:chorismate synthase [Nitrospiraceae bacterium]
MARLRFSTAGESHGRALAGIIEGIPSGMSLSSGDIDGELRRRQGGYGRGGRMKIESDRATILSGVRRGRTLGSPIALLVENRDWENWRMVMNPDPGAKPEPADGKGAPVTRPRPGHADLAGALKYDQKDLRNILERSSARETAMRVALGAVAKKFLAVFGILIGSHVLAIGSQKAKTASPATDGDALMNLFEEAEKSPVRCADPAASKRMIRRIDAAIKDGDSVGGVFEVFATGVPVGLGSHTQWDLKLDGRLAQALMGIQAIKAVETGLGLAMAEASGSRVMDEIFYDSSPSRPRGLRFFRKSNNAGGIEGGMSNGMPIIIRAAMKPIPTLRRPLMSVDIRTKKPFEAAYERSDVCAVPAAAVVGEAMAALVLTDAFLEKFGGDSEKEIRRNYRSYLSQVDGY